MGLHTITRMLCFFVVISVALQLGLSAPTKSEEILQPDLSGIDFKDGRLSVSIISQPFKKVMGEISKKSGRRIVIKDDTDVKLTANFDYLPLEAGLRRLLKGKNYVFFYSSDQMHRNSMLTQVLVLPRSGSLKVERTAIDANDESVEKDKAFAKKLLELDQETKENLFKVISMNAEELQVTLQEASESIQKIGVSPETHQALENALRDFPLSGENLEQKAYAPLEGEKGTQGLIIRQGNKKLSE